MNAYHPVSTDPDHPPSAPSCPRCHGPLERIRRRFLDRVISLAVPVRRYRCPHFSCQWEGLRRRRRAEPAPA